MWDHQDGGLLSSELVKKSREKILNGEARTNAVGILNLEVDACRLFSLNWELEPAGVEPPVSGPQDTGVSSFGE